MKILTIDVHPSVGTQLNYSVTSWKWGKDMIELKLDNGKIVQINPSYVIAIVCTEVEDEKSSLLQETFDLPGPDDIPDVKAG